MNGIGYHGIFRASAPLFCFRDYCRAAIRLAALSRLPNMYIFSRLDRLGEDGRRMTGRDGEWIARIPQLDVIRPGIQRKRRERCGRGADDRWPTLLRSAASVPC